MKIPWQLLCVCALSGWWSVSDAAAQSNESASQYAASDDDGGTNEVAPRVACNGALCDTTNDSTCSVALVGKARASQSSLLALLLAVALLPARCRRRRHRLLDGFIVLGMGLGTTTVASANADVAREPVVEVGLTPAHRALVIAWNPLSLLGLQTLSVSGIWAPADHSALVVSPFYADVTTVPISVYDTQGQQLILPKQRFHGFGAELGYRYYFDEGGPRGPFVGPSIVISHITATALNGSHTPFLDLGIAADAGWQALVADRVALAVGLGLQVIETSRSIPRQQFPARVYADRGVLPRFLCSIGWAF